MTRKEIAELYINLLQKGDMEGVISLFSNGGIVHSPIYGIKKASDFYKELAADTSDSNLTLNGIFEESDSSRIALYFNFLWTLKNGELVNFDVVDILVFDEEDKITELRIIYDTVISREAVASLK